MFGLLLLLLLLPAAVASAADPYARFRERSVMPCLTGTLGESADSPPLCALGEPRIDLSSEVTADVFTQDGNATGFLDDLFLEPGGTYKDFTPCSACNVTTAHKRKTVCDGLHFAVGHVLSGGSDAFPDLVVASGLSVVVLRGRHAVGGGAGATWHADTGVLGGASAALCDEMRGRGRIVSAHVVDWDGDGTADVAVSMLTNSSAVTSPRRMLVARGPPPFSGGFVDAGVDLWDVGPVDAQGGWPWTPRAALAVGDVDGDGAADILEISHPPTIAARWHPTAPSSANVSDPIAGVAEQLRRSAAFSGVLFSGLNQTGLTFLNAVTRDVDGDLDLDLAIAYHVAAHSSFSGVLLLMNDGDALAPRFRFSDIVDDGPQIGAVVSRGVSMGAAVLQDINRDGHADLVRSRLVTRHDSAGTRLVAAVDSQPALSGVRDAAAFLRGSAPVAGAPMAPNGKPFSLSSRVRPFWMRTDAPGEGLSLVMLGTAWRTSLAADGARLPLSAVRVGDAVEAGDANSVFPHDWEDVWKVDGEYARLTTCDANSDMRDDVVASLASTSMFDPPTGVRVYLRPSSGGAFSATPSFEHSFGVRMQDLATSAADLTGDGVMDLMAVAFVPNDQHVVRGYLFAGAGNGSFAAPTVAFQLPLPESVMSFAFDVFFGAFTGNPAGPLDLVIFRPGTSLVGSCFLVAGTLVTDAGGRVTGWAGADSLAACDDAGSYWPLVSQASVSFGAFALSARDVNEDGAADLALFQPDTQTLFMLPGTADASCRSSCFRGGQCDPVTGACRCDESRGGSRCHLCTSGYSGAGNSVGVTTACEVCQPGKFSAAEGSAACLDCLAGRVAANTGAHVCTPCDPGHVASTDGLGACDPCRDGRVPAGDGKSCVLCPPGSFVDALVPGSCRECAGAVVPGPNGTMSCVRCEAGRFVDREARAANVTQPRCADCVAGRYTVSANQPSCETCPIGTYSLTSQRDSACEGTCPAHATCVNGEVTASEGFFLFELSGGEITARQCAPGFCAGGGSVDAPRCARSRPSAPDNVLCASCAPGYSDFTGTECVRCERTSPGAVAGLLVAMMLYLAVLIALAASEGTARWASVKAMVKVFFFWSSTFVLLLRNNLPLARRVGLDGPSQIPGLCVLGPANRADRIVFDLLLPALNFALLAVWLGIFSCVRRAVPRLFARHARLSAMAHPTTHATAAITVLVQTYTTVAAAAVELLHCTEPLPAGGGHNAGAGDGGSRRVVFSAPTLDCDSVAYRWRLALAAAMIALHVAAFPIMTLAVVVADRRGVGCARRLLRVLRVAYDGYCERFVWWETPALLRRFALACMSVLLSRHPMLRDQMLASTLLALLVLQVAVSPFDDAVANRLELGSLLSLVVLSVYVRPDGTDGVGPLSAAATWVANGIALAGIAALVAFPLRRACTRALGHVREKYGSQASTSHGRVHASDDTSTLGAPLLEMEGAGPLNRHH